MREVRLAFYKATGASWTDRVISGWTWIFNMFTLGCSHVEIGFFIGGEWRYFSSSIRDGGTRWKDGKELLKNFDRWDVRVKDYPDETVDQMIERAKGIEGLPYDKWGIAGFGTITGLIFNKKSAWYCSEACWYVLFGAWKKRISPRRMWKRTSNEFIELYQKV